MINGWHKIKLEKVAKHIQSGGTPKSDNPEYYKGDIPFVSIEDMTASHKYLYKTIKTISIEGLKNSSAWIVPKNSVMYSIYATLGLPNISKIEAATNQAILNIIPHSEKIDTEFLYYYLLSLRYSIYKFSSQTTQSNLNAKIVRGFDLYIPQELLEQKKVASILSKTDEAIEQTEKIIAKYQRIKAGLMQDLLTKGIDEHGNIRSEKTHRFKTENGLRVPEEWIVKSSSELLNIINGGTPSTSTNEYWENGTIPWLSVDDFNNEGRYVFTTTKQITPKGLLNSSTCLLPKNALIISARGTVGVISQLGTAMSFNQSCYGLISKNEKMLSNDFLYYSLKLIFDTGSVVKSGSVFDTITRKTFSEILVSFPNNELEFNKIVEIISTLDKFICEQKVNHLKLLSLKTGLMQDLLSGKVRVKIKEEATA